MPTEPCYTLDTAMGIRFDEAKATQAAAYVLSLFPDKKTHYFHLIKLLYLADRQALLQRGIPITTDTFAAMKHGPILSTIYDLIKKKGNPKPIWSQYISEPSFLKLIRLVKPAPTNKLSRAEEKILKAVFNQYGRWYRFKLRDYVMHKLPEWKDPGETSIPISIAQILRAGGEDDDHINAIQAELNAFGREEGKFHKVAK
jgi:uncharacterized phage-associated protein